MAAPRSQRPQFTSIYSSAWSYHDHTCASIGNDFRVHFLNSSGADLLNLRITRNQRAMTICWSIVTNSLAIGWSDGTLSVWNDGGNIIDGEPLEKSPINHTSWHPLLPILITSTRNGLISFWNIGEKLTSECSIQSQVQVYDLLFSPIENLTAYVVSKEGNIYLYQKSLTEVKELAALPKPIIYASLNSDGTKFISVSGDNILSIYKIEDNGVKFTRMLQKKLDSGENVMFAGISDEFLCYSINDTVYLALSEDATEIAKVQAAEGDKIISIQFYTASNELAAMTSAGRVVVWKMDREKKTFSISRRLESGIETKTAYWSPYAKNAITIAAADESFSMCTVPVIRCLSTKDVVVLQTDTKSLSLNGNHRKRFQFNIERLAASGSHLLVASDSGARVFAMGFGSLSSVAEFQIPSSLTEILGENIYVANGKELEIRNIKGEIKQTLQIESNSSIAHMALNGKYLCLATQNSHPLQLFLYDVSRRVPSIVAASQFSIKNKIYRVRSIAVSRGGFCVSISLDFFSHGQWEISSKLYLHSPMKQKTVALPIQSGSPISHLWDTISGRILCVQTPTTVSTFFVNTNLESSALRPITMGSERVIFRVETPRVLHVLDGSRGPPLSVDGSVSASLMSQFSTIDGIEAPTRRILIEILFNVLTEQRDSALKIVQGITDEFIARDALRFCLAINEREFAEICSQKLKQEKVVESITDDKLSFINHLSSASYEDAATVCAPNDKLNIRANTYLSGLMSEFDGNIEKAIEYFDVAECKAPEVLRIAMHSGNLKQIFMTSVGGNSDPQLHRWIGRFYEYHQMYDSALSHFDICGDLRESIRLLCILGRYDEVNRRINDTDQRSAICFYARLLIKKVASLNPEDVQTKNIQKQIIELFKKALQPGPAFEFAFSNNMVDELIKLSLSAPRPLVAKAAQQFENRNNIRIAALLYHRAGRMNKALSLCLESNSRDALEEIADSVKEGTDPEVLEKCAELFIINEQFKRAANFFALAKRVDRAKDICVEHNVKLPQEFIDTLATLKMDPANRRAIAELCEQQEAYITAAQIYIKLKDHISAMRNIIAAGDTDKVVKFATLLNRKDAYICAADYIAGTAPREGQPLFITCLQFYQRGESYDKIAEFLDKTAMNEIEEYQNYTKAEELLKRAHQTMARAEMTKERDAMVESCLQKIRWIEMYIEATRCVQTDPLRMQSLCNELLQTRGVDKCLRIEDVYMLLVQYFVTQENFSQAHRILENMRMNGVDLKDFMEEESIVRIYRAAGQTYVAQEEEIQEEEPVDDIPDDIVEAVSDDF